MDGNGQEIFVDGYNKDNSYRITSEYVAGFFDGEGCIRVLGSSKNKYVGLHLFITNTYKPILEKLKSKYGGSVVLRTKSTDKHRTYYQWRLSSKSDISRFIYDIIDFSIEKRAQLLLGLEYCNLPTLTVNRHSSKYPEVLLQQLKRKEIAEQMSRLKKINY